MIVQHHWIKDRLNRFINTSAKKILSVLILIIIISLSLKLPTDFSELRSPQRNRDLQDNDTPKVEGAYLDNPERTTRAEEDTNLHNDFSLNEPPGNIVKQENPRSVTIYTDEYGLNVDWNQQSWVSYKIFSNFTDDYVLYRRMNPEDPGEGTVDEFGNPLDDVDMTVASWRMIGNVVWFNESCQEFSLNHTFTFFRDYMELNVTYSPGIKNVLTTYFVGLYSQSGILHNMFENGIHRYVPGFPELTPATHGIGGWYPTYLMYAPAIDMRVPNGNLGFEMGYNDSIAYLYSPIWMKDLGIGGASVFGLKYSSINSIIPNIANGTPETFHSFIRIYQYNDKAERGHNDGYSKWATHKIIEEWGFHDVSVFPLAVMYQGEWSPEFRNWVEASNVTIATYTNNPNQIDWNYGSAWQRNRRPANDSSIVPDDWELWGPGNKSQYAPDGDLILNPVSGDFLSPGSFRHHLIEDNPLNNWWWGSKAVFWDEMNVYDPFTRPRNDYHNRSEFIYDGYLRLIQESYLSGHWNITISNPYTALLHLSILSDMTIVESYRDSNAFGVDFVNHVHSTMSFVNNIPVEYRPNILVYQYYEVLDSDDQEDAYRAIFGSVKYGFDLSLISWGNQSHQLRNLELAEEMYLTMGANRERGTTIHADTIDLDEGDYLSSDARIVVWTGDNFNPTVHFSNLEDSYYFSNLRGEDTSFSVLLNTSKYFIPGPSIKNSYMTYMPNGQAWFNASISNDKTDFILKSDLFQVRQLNNGTAEVQLLNKSEMITIFSIQNIGGYTNFNIGGLKPNTGYRVYTNGRICASYYSDSLGDLTFDLAPDEMRTIIVYIINQTDQEYNRFNWIIGIGMVVFVITIAVIIFEGLAKMEKSKPSINRLQKRKQG